MARIAPKPKLIDKFVEMKQPSDMTQRGWSRKIPMAPWLPGRQRAGPTHPGRGVLRAGWPTVGRLKPKENFTYRAVQFSGPIFPYMT
jgi:hypothetical protein